MNAFKRIASRSMFVVVMMSVAGPMAVCRQDGYSADARANIKQSPVDVQLAHQAASALWQAADRDT